MITIKVVPRTMQHRRKFRTLARDNCGESMEPGENEKIYFCYPSTDQHQKGNPIACGSLLLASPDCQNVESRDYYHWITYIFVNERHKYEGCGTLLLRSMQHDAWFAAEHAIRADVAHKAVVFFEKNGYVSLGDPWRPAAGSSYFRKLYTMELENATPKQEIWDV